MALCLPAKLESGTHNGWWSTCTLRAVVADGHIVRTTTLESSDIFQPYVGGFAWAWMALLARNASPWLFTRFRDFEPPEHVPRTSARAYTYTQCSRGPPAPQPRARDKTRWWKNKKCRCPKLSHILHSNIYMHENQESASKLLPNLEKACIMPWDVLEKKRTDHSYTPEVRSSSYSMLR